MEPLFSEDIKRAVEALLFVAGEPLTLGELAEYTQSDLGAISEIMEVLAAEYRTKGFHLTQVGGGWQFMTQPELHHFVERLYQPKIHRLSRAAMETLAIIAYCQPVTRSEIEEIRGVNADSIVSGLLEKGLLDEVGRKETPGKPVLYGTNQKFLELLGLNSLDELPQVDLNVPASPSLFSEKEDAQPTLFQNTHENEEVEEVTINEV